MGTRKARETVGFNGFSHREVPFRTFKCELKYRPDGDDGGNEVFLEEFTIALPRLKDTNLEKQWCFAIAWGKLYSPEWKEKGINQCFIFNSDYSDLIARLERQEFTDEPMQRIGAPSEENWQLWANKVKSKFKKLYGFDLVGI